MMFDRLWTCKPVPPISVLRHIAPPTEDLRESKKSSLAWYSCQAKLGMRGGGKSQRFQWKRAHAFQKCFAFLHLLHLLLSIYYTDPGPEASTYLFRRSHGYLGSNDSCSVFPWRAGPLRWWVGGGGAVVGILGAWR